MEVETRHEVSLLKTMSIFLQFSYGSFQSKMSNKANSPSFYRMVPNEAVQYLGIIQLLQHFRWKWVGLLVIDDEAGDHFLKTLEPMLAQSGICSGFTDTVTNTFHIRNVIEETFENILRISPTFMESKVNVFLIYGETSTFIWLADMVWLITLKAMFPQRNFEYEKMASKGKMWITTAQIDFAFTFFEKALDIQMLQGATSFTIHSNQLFSFTKYLQNLRPSGTKGDGFVNDFWEQAFDCILVPNSSDANESCTGEEKLESLPGQFFEMSMTGHSYSIYNAVYVVAHVLHRMYLSRTNHRALADGDRMTALHVEPWQVSHPHWQWSGANSWVPQVGVMHSGYFAIHSTKSQLHMASQLFSCSSIFLFLVRSYDRKPMTL